MRTGIHPRYFATQITCACGSKFDTGSTAKGIHTEICSACHPFFTGKQKSFDAEGRVERFRRKYNIAAPVEPVEAVSDTETPATL